MSQPRLPLRAEPERPAPSGTSPCRRCSIPIWRPRSGGRLLLRIEDIDRLRCDARFEAGILADLAWLGVGFEPTVRRQSEHFDDYGRALRKLAEMDLVYPRDRNAG